MTSPFSYKPAGASSATTISVLLGSATGLHNDTAEIQTVYTSQYIGEIVTRITQSKRPVSFRIPVSASSEAGLNTAIRDICTLFVPSETPGKLYCAINSPSRYLNVYPSGTPEVEYQSNTCAFVTVTLTAADPYWYSSATPTTYSSGQTITNSGMYPAPVSMAVASGATSVTLSVGGTVTATISRKGTSTIAGDVISVTDSTVTAMSGSSNVLSNFDISSDWFMVPVGQSVITGANSITIQQRWSTP